MLGETNAEPLESIQLRLPNSSATTNKTSKWIKAGGSARTFNPAALAQLQNRRRLPLANGTHKMSTVVVVNECVNPLLVHNFSGGPTDRKVSGGGGTPTVRNSTGAG